MKRVAVFGLATLFMAGSASAQNTGAGSPVSSLPNPADALIILTNVSQHFPVIFDLITILATVVGIFYMGNALYGIYRVSSPQGYWSGRQHTTAGSVASLMVGVILTCAPYIHRVIGNAIYGANDLTTGNAFTYQTTGMSADQITVYTALMDFFAICGYAFFIVGWTKIRAHYQSHTNTLWTGFWQIVGGVGLIYLPDTIDFFMSLTGVNFVQMIIF